MENILGRASNKLYIFESSRVTRVNLNERSLRQLERRVDKLSRGGHTHTHTHTPSLAAKDSLHNFTRMYLRNKIVM